MSEPSCWRDDRRAKSIGAHLVPQPVAKRRINGSRVALASHPWGQELLEHEARRELTRWGPPGPVPETVRP